MSNKAKIGFSLFSCVYLVTTSLSGDALARRRLVPDMPSVEIHYEALMALKSVPQEADPVPTAANVPQKNVSHAVPEVSALKANGEKAKTEKKNTKSVKKTTTAVESTKNPAVIVPEVAAQKSEAVKSVVKKEEKKPVVAPAIADVAKPVETPKVLPKTTEEIDAVKPLQPVPSHDTSPKVDDKPEEALKPLEPDTSSANKAPTEEFPKLAPLPNVTASAPKESVVQELEKSAKGVDGTAKSSTSNASKDEELPPLQSSGHPTEAAVVKPLEVQKPALTPDDEVLPAIAVPVSPAPNAPVSSHDVPKTLTPAPAPTSDDDEPLPAAPVASPAPVATAPVAAVNGVSKTDDDEDARPVVAPVHKDEGFFSGLKKATKKLIGSETPKLQAKARPIPRDDDDDAPATAPSAKSVPVSESVKPVVPASAVPATLPAPAPVKIDDDEGVPLPPLPKTGQAAPASGAQDIAALQSAKGGALPSLDLLKNKAPAGNQGLDTVPPVSGDALPPLPATASSTSKIAIAQLEAKVGDASQPAASLPTNTPFGKPSMEAVKPSKPVPAPVAVVESEELPPLSADAKGKVAAQVVMPPAVETVAAGASVPTQLASLETPPAASTPILPKVATKTGNAMASIAFAEGEIQLPKGQESVLADVAKQKKNMILVLAYADPKSNNTNVRHEALARALAIRATLIDSGMASKNIRTEVKSDAIPSGSANRVDIVSDDDED